MHFGVGEAELFPLGENMLVPREPSVQVESEVFDVFRLGELHIVEMDRWAGSTSRCELEEWKISAFVSLCVGSDLAMSCSPE
jgi:hypothetical protein